jgi:hypothetical protein
MSALRMRMQPCEPGRPISARIRAAVDVDVTAHGIDTAQAIAARFAARQPEDARQNPVTTGKCLTQRRRPDFSGRPTADERLCFPACPAPILARMTGAFRAASDSCRTPHQRRPCAVETGVFAQDFTGSSNTRHRLWRPPRPAVSLHFLPAAGKEATTCVLHSSASTPPTTVAW